MLLEEMIGEISGAAVQKRAVTDLRVLNEAYDYARPSSFSRGMRIDLNGLVVLLISGTASIDENGETVHVGDFRAQCRRMGAGLCLWLRAAEFDGYASGRSGRLRCRVDAGAGRHPVRRGFVGDTLGAEDPGG